jgi:hypothetical protein
MLTFRELLDKINILLKTKDYQTTFDIVIKDNPIEDVELLFQLLNIDLSNDKQKEDRINGFRQNIIDRYEKCIITGCDNMKRCDICHIKPFNECTFKQKYDINNGIILRKDLHTLFDNYELSINPYEKTIEISIKNKDEDVIIYNNKVVDVFDESLEYLKIHYDEFLRKN